MMSKVKGQLSYEIYVKCPNCGDVFDIIAEDYQNEDGCITTPLFRNDWDNCRDSTACPKCEFEFEMEGVEY